MKSSSTSLAALDEQDFVTHQQGLLLLEREEEQEQRQQKYSDHGSLRIFQRLQTRGDAILNLCAERPSESATSLEGHALLILSRVTEHLPSHKFTTGDNVSIQNLQQQISQHKKETTTSSEIKGVVYKVSREKITIASESLPDSQEIGFDVFATRSLLLIKLADDITYHRLGRALEKVANHHNVGGKEIHANNTRLIETLFYQRKPVINTTDTSPIEFHNANLNASQQEAIQFCLQTCDIGLIHGPPGTGKTTTVVEFILQCVDRGQKVLACAPSNVAVDNLVLGILPYIQVDKKKVPKPKIIRAGHPARMLPEVVDFSLEHILQTTSATSIVREVSEEITQKTRSLEKTGKNKIARSQIYRDLRALRKELLQRQRKAVKELIQRTDVLLSTNTGCDSKYLALFRLVDEIGGFDVVVIDEAAQSLEAACWIAILLGKKVILAGDHLQLPPTILSRIAAGKQPNGFPGLEETLFDRLMRNIPSVTRLLNIQYRMNSQIMKWSSDALYEGKLMAHESVEGHLLCDLPIVKKTPLTRVPLCLIDTCGELNEQKYEEEEENARIGSAHVELESKWNEGEAQIVQHIVEELLHNGVPETEIGVITPYNAQVELLRTLISQENIEIGTVDGFQGREKEAILISTVRSNNEGDIGFLSECRRMNVAVTRARRLVVIVCDSTTLHRNEFLNEMLDYFQTNKECLYLTHFDYKMQLQHSEEDLARETAIAKQKAATAIAKAKEQLKTTGQEQMKKSKEAKKPKDLGQVESAAKIEIEERVNLFCEQDEENSITFPPNTKSYLRKFIHELAEKKNLIHVTEQIGDNRVITISKRAETKKELSEENEEELKDVEPTNSEIPEKVNTKIQVTNTRQQDKKKNTKKKGGKPQFLQAAEANSNTTVPALKGQKAKRREGESIDGIMAELNIKDPNMCFFGTCRRPTNILTDPCKFCNAKFCHNHSMAEIHGCGDGARNAARRDWLSTSAGHKPLSDEQKETARKEIRKKIAKSSSGRKPKRGKKGKKR